MNRWAFRVTRACVAGLYLVGTSGWADAAPPSADGVSGATSAAGDAGFHLEDGRPKPEETEWLSQSSFSCQLGIRRLGDDITPHRIDVLREDLRAKTPENILGKTLIVRRYSIFINSHRGMANTIGGMGLFGALTAPTQCTKEDTPEGWYEPSEIVQSQKSQLVVEISVDIDGKKYFAHLAHQSTVGMPPRPHSESEQKEILTALHEANQVLINELPEQ